MVKHRVHLEGFRRKKLQQQRQTQEIVQDFLCETNFSLFLNFSSFFHFFIPSFFLFFHFSFLGSSKSGCFDLDCFTCHISLKETNNFSSRLGGNPFEVFFHCFWGSLCVPHGNGLVGLAADSLRSLRNIPSRNVHDEKHNPNLPRKVAWVERGGAISTARRTTWGRLPIHLSVPGATQSYNTPNPKLQTLNPEP